MKSSPQTPLGLSRKRKAEVADSSNLEDASAMGSALGLSTSLQDDVSDDTPLAGYRKQRRTDKLSSDESPLTDDLLWIQDSSAGETPATLPRAKKAAPMRRSMTTETPLRALRFSGEMEQQTPTSQLLSQLSHIENPSEDGPPPPSPRDSGHYDESLLALLRNKDITASRPVTLQNGCELPSPATPLWGHLSTRSSTRLSNDQRNFPSAEVIASQPVDIFEEDEFVGESTHMVVKEEETQGQQLSGISATQVAEDISATNDRNNSGSLSKLRHPSDAELLNDFVRSTRDFFAFIDQRPLLCTTSSPPKATKGSTHPMISRPSNKPSTPASKFERVMANVKRKMKRSN